ncbi:DUF1361 domain-containing protein [Cohnella lubricantis]|uniref:DUF1361 domain-containing protein n=1 Tax=Cohnella lubricantis TaxID=2163172 RepID=A0A841TB14_9BACL|nr:DUF1361 domain-containing protein [Cohnella lubricantis]MBB6676440.1 DUF1361 domain-containing protein [Cohnella lubricantis]MBP2117553.1 putative membrane protein [Cohnella lubricantis]
MNRSIGTTSTTTPRSAKHSAPSPRPSVVQAPIFLVLCGNSLLCVLLLIVRAYQLETLRFGFLLWNLFLAWLPLIVSMLAAGLHRGVRGAARTIGIVVLGIAWVLLYPNAPYLTTDLIHLINDPTYNWYIGERSLLVWYDLIVFVLFSWCGLLLGYLSMYHFHALVRTYAGRTAGWLFVLVVSFLGGFGIYLGRVIRLNSWDAVFNPFRLIDGVREGLGSDGAVFTILFGLLILIVYLSMSSLHMKRPEP